MPHQPSSTAGGFGRELVGCPVLTVHRHGDEHLVRRDMAEVQIRRQPAGDLLLRLIPRLGVSVEVALEKQFHLVCAADC